MADIAVGNARGAWQDHASADARDTWRPIDARRALQLALAAVWLLDGVLQYQSVMFTRAFGRMLAASAAGNPAVIATPITWDAHLIEQHGVALNTIFATVQLLLGIGIAWRPAARIALGASIAWALAVWWLGEGLGGVLTASPSPVSGAPGAVIIYALLAVVLWPADRSAAAPFTAARAVGTRIAKLLWCTLWASLAYFSLLAGNRTAQGLHDLIASTGSAEPGWVAALDGRAAALLSHQGLTASIVLAAALAVIAIGVFLPPPLARATIVLAIVVSAAIWVIGQAFGGILTGSGTDPDSGLPLLLLALAYWPAVARPGPRVRPAATTAGRAGERSPA
jgi:hypothetical protein